MWDTTFEESMLEESMLSANPGIAIYCEDVDKAKELFDVFKRHGIGKNWNAGMHGDSVYCVSKRIGLQYGSKDAVESIHPYSSFIKCTFYGINTPDFDIASDDELRALLVIGGD